MGQNEIEPCEAEQEKLGSMKRRKVKPKKEKLRQFQLNNVMNLGILKISKKTRETEEIQGEK